MKLILGSTSPARKALLSRLQIPFEVASPHVDESPLLGERAEAMVERLAILKARAVASKYPESFIIGADSVGVLEGKLLTKPLTMERAIEQLQSMSGKATQFYTGICLYNSIDGAYQSAVECYEVCFRELSLATIKQYLKKEDTLQCAGGVQAEGLGITLIKKFSGEDFTTLIGLPLIRLTSMLLNVNFAGLHHA